MITKYETVTALERVINSLKYRNDYINEILDKDKKDKENIKELELQFEESAISNAIFHLEFALFEIKSAWSNKEELKGKLRCM